jgi:hypothetical protein
VKPYKPSGIVSRQGLLILLGRAGIAVVVAGGFLWFTYHVVRFYLDPIFPFIAGAIVGYGVISGVRVGKVRNPALASLIAVLGTVLAFGLSHYLAYEVSFKNTAREAFASQGPKPTSTELQILTDAYLNKEVGSEGFIGYLKLEAKQGFTVAPLGSSIGTSYKGVWAWFQLLFELVLIGFFVMRFSATEARDYFDEKTQTWFGRSLYLGGAGGVDGTAMANALKAGAFDGAAAFIRPQRAELGLPRVELHARLSPDENADQAVLEVKSVAPGERKNTYSTKPMFSGLVTREELLRLKPQVA